MTTLFSHQASLVRVVLVVAYTPSALHPCGLRNDTYAGGSSSSERIRAR